MKSIFSFVLLFISISGFGITEIPKAEIKEISIAQFDSIILQSEVLSFLETKSDSNLLKTKLIAIALALTVGIFGVHRLYLGTKPIVPIAYTLTLGGGFFILPVIDIIYIISAKELKQIKNNDSVFIWNKRGR